MHLLRCSGVRIALSIIVTAAIFTYRLSVESHDDSHPIAGLQVTIQQTGTSPLTINTTVTNKNTYPVTVLRYNSPLDPLAPKLGLLSITPSLELPTIQIRRAWPPRPDSLIHFEPGASESAEIVLEEHAVDGLGEKASVLLKGRWDMAWSKPKDCVTDEVLEQIHTSSDVFTGGFASNNLEISIIGLMEKLGRYDSQTRFMRQSSHKNEVPKVQS